MDNNRSGILTGDHKPSSELPPEAELPRVSTVDRPFGLPAPVVLNLPYPPSINSIWRRAGKHIHRSAKYLAWINEAGWTAQQQKPRRVHGHYSLSIEATRPDKRRRDLDNAAFKCVSDLLVSLGIIEDDSLCVSLSAKWVKGEKGVRVTIDQAEAA